MTAAVIGLGILVQLSVNGTVWTSLDEAYSVSPPSDTADMVDATHYQSPSSRREFISGLIDGGEVSVEGNYIAGSTTDTTLVAAMGVTRYLKITYANGVTVQFQAVRQGYEKSLPVDDRQTFTATFKVTGAVTQTAAAAPTNTLVPSIAGTPQNGQTLTAVEGVWTGAPTFTYQWKKGGVNIGGATNRTYTLIAGDIGGIITVAVTGTNTVGNATATSANSATVIA